MTDYDREATNNNTKTIDILKSVFPDLFNEETIDTLLKVQNGISFVREKTGVGTILVHVYPTKSVVEFRGKFSEEKLDISNSFDTINESNRKS